MAKQSQQRIGILGGTFDPIHHGHLLLAEEARDQFALDRVLFVPAAVPPHKDAMSVSPPDDRYVMTVLATSDHPHFEVSRVDLDREGVNFTVDMLRLLTQQYPGATLFFVTGADSLLQLLTWKDPHAILSMCHFVVANRPGFDLSQAQEVLGDFYTKFADRIHLFDVPGFAVSSTEVRRLVRNGRSIRYLVHDNVLDFIAKTALYRDRA